MEPMVTGHLKDALKRVNGDVEEERGKRWPSCSSQPPCLIRSPGILLRRILESEENKRAAI
jgi:hypothetical protein